MARDENRMAMGGTIISTGAALSAINSVGLMAMAAESRVWLSPPLSPAAPRELAS